MSKAVTTEHQVSPYSRDWIRGNVDRIETLPAPGDTWGVRDTNFSSPFVSELRERGFVKAVGRLSSAQSNVREYRTVPEAFEVVTDVLEKRDKSGYRPCPCGHRGLTNLGGDEYDCLKDDCSETFSRTEVDV